MDIGISTACFYPMLTEDALVTIGELGFSTIEVFFNADREYNPSFCKKLKSIAEYYNITISSTHPVMPPYENITLFSNYKRRKDDAIVTYEKVLRGSEILGSKYLTFHGELNHPNKTTNIENYCSVVDELVIRAENHGILLAQENVSRCRSFEPGFLKDLRENTKVMFTLDIKQAVRAGIELDEYIAAMGNRIVNVHINDCNDNKECLLPGEGQFDFKSFFDKFKKLDYKNNFIIEVYSKNFKDKNQLINAKNYLLSLV